MKPAGSHVQFTLWPKVELLVPYPRDGYLELVEDANDKGTAVSLVLVRWRKWGIRVTIPIG